MKPEEHKLPTIESMESIPPGSNPYMYDMGNMGKSLSGAWEAMFPEFGGLKQEHNMTQEELVRRENGEAIYYDDPPYIIIVNRKTGQRFRLVFQQ